MKRSKDNQTSNKPSKILRTTDDKQQKSGHWTQGLKQTLKNPENIIMETNLCSVIKDKYPKAKVHYLIIAKGEISSLKSLNSKHVSLLNHMIEVGHKLEDIERKEQPAIQLQMGFHAVPSMTLLHMHVISKDFDSTFLKNKRHWNSFATNFFRPAEVILVELKDKGSIVIDNLYYKQLLESSLKCHMCDFTPKNIPRLKDHVKTHFS